MHRTIEEGEDSVQRVKGQNLKSVKYHPQNLPSTHHDQIQLEFKCNKCQLTMEMVVVNTGIEELASWAPTGKCTPMDSE